MTTDTRALNHHTVTANGIRRHVRDAGECAVVVLTHGRRETGFARRRRIPHQRGNN
ncbi:hypothetical protein [Burkholderia sp. AU19243]|uniref:hypothetical protein n=1 Tax=Burkholderia sp. AU19243 TaxID=2824810 RepID=UPI0020110971|nr:hypothetical protein [Burkholderia sp. AU19243]